MVSVGNNLKLFYLLVNLTSKAAYLNDCECLFDSSLFITLCLIKVLHLIDAVAAGHFSFFCDFATSVP